MNLPSPQTSQLETVRQKLANFFSKSIKKSKARLENFETRLNECLAWEKTYHQGILLQSNLYLVKPRMTEITIADWDNNNKETTIPLDPTLSPHQHIAKFFKKAKKLEAGIIHYQRLVKEEQDKLQQYASFIEQIALANSLEELKPFAALLPSATMKRQVVAQEKKTLPYREFHSSTGTKIWVGKGAQKNDLLTFRYAKGSDWWLHAKDYPGAHVVIRVAKNEIPDQTTLQEAMQLAVHFSKAKNNQMADVSVTQCKHVARYGKVAGTVFLSKHKSYSIAYDPHLVKKIVSSKAE